MANTIRAPKQWCLSKSETVNFFENWKQNILYTLSLDANFATYLTPGKQWGKKTIADPLRGLTDDGEGVPQARRKTAQQKVTTLELLLGQIANYCPIISRNTIIKNSTSVDQIWQAIRLHYGFQSTGAHFIDFSDILLLPDERPEDLYQRLMAFVDDNLLRNGGGITHHGENITEDEELTPSLENFVVLTWLRLIHKDLPRLVKQRYGTELRSRTLASIKPEISQALDSLIDEIRTSEDTKVMRTTTWRQKPKSPQVSKPDRPPAYKTEKSCPICKASGKTNNNHFLSECKFLPDRDRRFMLRARQIVNILDTDDTDLNINDHSDVADALPEDECESPTAYRVQVRQSPYLDAFYRHHTIRVTIDSGATGNMIRHSTAVRLGVDIKDSSQSAHQADGSSPLNVVGETKFTLHRNKSYLIFEGLVVSNLDVDVLAGTPFMEANDISVRPAKRQIRIREDTVVTYGSTSKQESKHTIRRACVLRAPSSTTTIWPGEYLEVTIPDTFSTQDEVLALEPRLDTRASLSKLTAQWPQATIVSSISGKIRIPNATDCPQVIRKNEHFCQVRPVFIPKTQNIQNESDPGPPPQNPKSSMSPYSSDVKLDPDNQLPADVRQQFQKVLGEYDNVFSSDLSGYNGASGPFQTVVNMGPVQPPQRKGRLPQYSKDKLVELQQKFDELEEQGVFVRPEDVGIQVEYLNPSFLIKKPNGGFRLVTAFSEVGRYSKPQPSLMPDVNSVLRQVGQWKYLITCDLTSAFYQIPLSKPSMKYCGVATPFKGIRVYARTAMGMPGSETALEELMCRILGDLLEEGIVTKLADDLYCGADTPEQLLANWKRVLYTLQTNNLKLSPKKTIIAPSAVTLLGWHWEQGTIRAGEHRIATLASCSPPGTVKGLRSFIGAYKVLARVIKGSSTLLSPLDDAVAGKLSQDKVVWSDSLMDAFEKAQGALSTNKSVVLPRPEDRIWIVTDGAVKMPGIGATLYVSRNEKLLLAGFFSAKLRKQQITWLPCEVEALAIAVATQHFSPYIIQSKHNTCILTDSKPCVQAYQKLCRGEFSTSPRVSSFLSTVSRFQATVQHLAGSSNLSSDFASRNAQDCEDPSCQVCSFIHRTEESVVRSLSVSDILSGNARPPFANKSAWRAIQEECKDLRRTHAHLIQGTRPSKKITDIKDVKRYLNSVTIAKDGLLVVKRNDPLSPSRECIVIPRQVLSGLLTALHIQLSHPTSYQLKKVVHRYFYALDMDKTIDIVTQQCHQCASLKSSPHAVIEQSTENPPDNVGITFAVDVMRRERQMILVLRECVTSFTDASIIENERHVTLRDTLLRLAIGLRPLDGPPAVIRTDPAPGFVALRNDTLLKQHRLTIELGRVKNQNKNPVAEKAIQELEIELLRHDPTRGPTNPTSLAIAVATLNSRLRNRGMSAREMWTQRDQFTNDQLPISDQTLILDQHSSRVQNHPHSEKSKAPTGLYLTPGHLVVGDLVYLHSDRNKSCARNRYLVVETDGKWCHLRKFTGSQLRKTSYKVKIEDCYKVPSYIADTGPEPAETEVVENSIESSQSQPEIPYIPLEISTPISQPQSSYSYQPDIEDYSNADTISPPPIPTSSMENIITDSSLEPTPSVRPSRARKLPSHFKDFVMDS